MMMLYNSIKYWISLNQPRRIPLQYETIFKLNSPSAISSLDSFFLYFSVHEQKFLWNKQKTSFHNDMG